MRCGSPTTEEGGGEGGEVWLTDSCFVVTTGVRFPVRPQSGAARTQTRPQLQQVSHM